MPAAECQYYISHNVQLLHTQTMIKNNNSIKMKTVIFHFAFLNERKMGHKKTACHGIIFLLSAYLTHSSLHCMLQASSFLQKYVTFFWLWSEVSRFTLVCYHLGLTALRNSWVRLSWLPQGYDQGFTVLEISPLWSGF